MFSKTVADIALQHLSNSTQPIVQNSMWGVYVGAANIYSRDPRTSGILLSVRFCASRAHGPERPAVEPQSLIFRNVEPTDGLTGRR